MTITLGYSPCPNDTFIFDAMIHHKIDTEGLEFEVTLADVEALNTMAFANTLMVTKLSYHAFAHLRNDYALLNAGSALGNNCGPLLIAKNKTTPNSNSTVAIPGKYTTANLLLSLAYPDLKFKNEILFSEIEQQVIDENVDFGLIIHENRFTYTQKGLVKIADLGEWWEQRTALPIPLGGIVIRRDMPTEIQEKINCVLRKSVEFAFANPAQTMDYVSLHAQEMLPEVMMAHINLYVNDYSIQLGERGQAAIEHLFAEAERLAVIAKSELPIFAAVG